MYHRFSSTGDPRRTQTSLLRKHLEFAVEHYEVVTFTEMMQRLETGKFSRRRPLVSFTIDDGYRDFYTDASAVFREFKVPATVFVTAGFVEERGWLWPDAIEYLVFRSPATQTSLRFSEHTFNIDLRTDSARRLTWDRLATAVLYDTKARADLIDALVQKLRVPLPEKSIEDFDPMSWEEIKDLVAQGVEIGGHTWSHAFLPDLSGSALRRELVESKAHLEARIGRTVTSFAYPNGQSRDAPDFLSREVANAGYRYATVATKPPSGPGTDRYRVGRWTADDNLFHFQNVLSGVSGLRHRLGTSFATKVD